MDQRLKDMLRGLTAHLQVMNEEVVRLSRSEQFAYEPHTLQFIEQARDAYLRGLNHLREVELQLHARRIENKGE